MRDNGVCVCVTIGACVYVRESARVCACGNRRVTSLSKLLHLTTMVKCFSYFLIDPYFSGEQLCSFSMHNNPERL